LVYCVWLPRGSFKTVIKLKLVDSAVVSWGQHLINHASQAELDLWRPLLDKVLYNLLRLPVTIVVFVFWRRLDYVHYVVCTHEGFLGAYELYWCNRCQRSIKGALKADEHVHHAELVMPHLVRDFAKRCNFRVLVPLI